MPIHYSEALTLLCLFFCLLVSVGLNCTVCNNSVILYGSVSYNQVVVYCSHFHIKLIAYCVVMRDLPSVFWKLSMSTWR